MSSKSKGLIFAGKQLSITYFVSVEICSAKAEIQDMDDQWPLIFAGQRWSYLVRSAFSRLPTDCITFLRWISSDESPSLYESCVYSISKITLWCDFKSMVVNEIVDIENFELIQCVVHCEWWFDKVWCSVGRIQMCGAINAIEMDNRQIQSSILANIGPHHPVACLIIWLITNNQEPLDKGTWIIGILVHKWKE